MDREAMMDLIRDQVAPRCADDWAHHDLVADWEHRATMATMVGLFPAGVLVGLVAADGPSSYITVMLVLVVLVSLAVLACHLRASYLDRSHTCFDPQAYVSMRMRDSDR